MQRLTTIGPRIRFRAKLCRPVANAKVGSWTFLTLPKNASAKLPSRGMTTVEGTINGFPFRATLEPDGQRSHCLRVNRRRCAKLRAQTQATSSRWRSRRREKNRNPGCRRVYGRLSRPPRRGRGRCGRTSRQSRAEIEALMKETGLDQQLKTLGMWDDWQSGARGRQP